MPAGYLARTNKAGEFVPSGIAGTFGPFSRRSPGRRKSRGETDCDALIPLQPPPATARASKSSADKAIRFGFIPSRVAQRDKHSKAHSVAEIPARGDSKDMILRGSIGKCDPRTEKTWNEPRPARRQRCEWRFVFVPAVLC